MIKLLELIEEAKNSSKKLDRTTFLYLDPVEPKSKFAQCSVCSLWTGDKCAILGDMKITADMSCNFFVPGEKNPDQKVQKLLTPKEAGLVTRQVRCENCISFDKKKSVCMLYQALNESQGDKFNLDEKVDPQGCCNAQRPK